MKRLDEQTIETWVADAFNGVFLSIQEYLGVETDDEAAYWFSGSMLESLQSQVVEEFKSYADHEADLSDETKSTGPSNAYLAWLERMERGFAELECVEELNKLDPEAALLFLRMRSDDENEMIDIVTKQFPVASGLYKFCTERHSGQSSRLYQIGSCLHLPPVLYRNHHDFDSEEPPEELSSCDEHGGDRHVYNLLCEWERGGWSKVDGNAKPGDPLDPWMNDYNKDIF